MKTEPEVFTYHDQPYLQDVVRLAKAERRTGLHLLVVEHDSWCGALHGGLCCCSPVVRKANRSERRKLKRGNLHEQ